MTHTNTDVPNDAGVEIGGRVLQNIIRRPDTSTSASIVTSHDEHSLRITKEYVLWETKNVSRKSGCAASIDFVECDFLGMLERAGFDVTQGQKSTNEFLQSIVATKR